MPKRYHVVSRRDIPATLDSAALAGFLAKDGQLLLPVLDLIENAQCAVDDLIDVMGRATIEAVLLMSAAGVAGPKQQGKAADRDVVYHGSQKGRVPLKERELRVDKPRLRRKHPEPGGPGEVEIPAYTAIRRNGDLADRMLAILIAGVSTRRYETVIPAMAETVGVSRSQVSRQTIEAGERLLKGLAERDVSKLDILAVWIDGLQLGPYHVICAVGVDADGCRHVLGLREGATENAVVASALLEDLVERGLDPRRRRLFVIDGSKASRKAIDLMFGGGTPVQRCRNHKLRNVLGHLPEAQHDQAKATFKAALKLGAKEGAAELDQYATWLEREWPSAAGSLPEGLDELFTINRLGLPSELRRCLGTTDPIDNGHSALRDRVRRVRNWQSGSMALRWAAVAFDAISQGFRRIMGYKHLRMLKAASDEPSKDRSLVEQAKAGERRTKLESLTRPSTTAGTSSTVDTDEGKGYGRIGRQRRRTHRTVDHSGPKSTWARDVDDDRVREVHCNTQEGLWTGLRNFRRPFRSVSKWYLAQYVAIFALEPQHQAGHG